MTANRVNWQCIAFQTPPPGLFAPNRKWKKSRPKSLNVLTTKRTLSTAQHDVAVQIFRALQRFENVSAAEWLLKDNYVSSEHARTDQAFNISGYFGSRISTVVLPREDLEKRTWPEASQFIHCA